MQFTVNKCVNTKGATENYPNQNLHEISHNSLTLSTGNTQQLLVLHYMAVIFRSDTRNEIRYQSQAVTLCLEKHFRLIE